MRIQGLLGVVTFLLVAWLISENRKRVKPQTVLTGVVVQFAIAAVLLYIPVFKRIFLFLNSVVLALDTSTKAGTAFVFGYLGGGPAPYATQDPPSSFILAFQALPLVLVIGALSSLLF